MDDYTKEIGRLKATLVGEVESEDWNGYLYAHERPYRFDALHRVRERVKCDKEFWELVGSLWQDSENIWQNMQGWNSLLGSGRPQSEFIMCDKDRGIVNSIRRQKRITVYRGVADTGTKHGMSWTLSSNTAEFFAKRWGRSGKVYKASVATNKVLAYFSTREEYEVLLPLGYVRGVKKGVVWQV